MTYAPLKGHGGWWDSRVETKWISSLASGEREFWKRSEVRMESSEKVWVSFEDRVPEWE